MEPHTQLGLAWFCSQHLDSLLSPSQDPTQDQSGGGWVQGCSRIGMLFHPLHWVFLSCQRCNLFGCNLRPDRGWGGKSTKDMGWVGTALQEEPGAGGQNGLGRAKKVTE